MKRCALLIAVAMLLVAGGAAAHARSVSYSTWTLEEHGASVRVQLSLLDIDALRATTLRGDDARLEATLVRALRLAPCTPRPGSFHELAADGGWRAFEWSVACPDAAGAHRVRSDLLFDAIPVHVHFARVRGAGIDMERALSASSRSFPVDSAPDRQTLAFVPLGVEHILSGWDHLAFLLALVLLGGSLRRTALVATGFTLGHSVTLALAVTGYAAPDSATVESLIGWSIALVAVENVWLARDRTGRLPAIAVAATAALAVAVALVGRASALAFAGAALFAGSYFGLVARAARPDRLRTAVAALFGLVHGFGFASVLGAMDLPRPRLLAALFGFNAGVELGQLAVLAVSCTLLGFLARRGARTRRTTLELGSALALACGVFWAVGRAL